jgi:hypothetical protein
MVTSEYTDLSAAFDCVSFAAPFEHRAFVSLDTGAVYCISERVPIDEEDLPDERFSKGGTESPGQFEVLWDRRLESMNRRRAGS